MILDFNTSDDKAIGGGLKEIIQEISDDCTKNILTLLYPTKVIKRFIFRPLLGRWYPYIDIKSEGYESQLSLFFGKINMKFSMERECSYCGKILDNLKCSIDFLPVLLCSRCFSKVYYGYWNCLKEVYNNNFANPTKNKNFKQRVICEDLFAPKCGYPIGSERTNPCLKNHAIGLIMVGDSTLKVIIGSLDALKYHMIWEGSLLGLILGYSNRIMNIEILEKMLNKIFLVLESCIEKFNNNDKNPENIINNSFFGEYKVKLISTYSNINNSLNNYALGQWILINFLRYYRNFEIKRFIYNFFEKPLSFLKVLLKGILKEIDIEILQFIELYKYFTPLSFDLRHAFEDNFKEMLDIKEIAEFSRNAIEHKAGLTFFDITKTFGNISFINFKALAKELEIYEILCALGPILIVNSNISDKPMLLSMYDLIGRKVY